MNIKFLKFLSFQNLHKYSYNLALIICLFFLSPVLIQAAPWTSWIFWVFIPIVSIVFVMTLTQINFFELANRKFFFLVGLSWLLILLGAISTENMAFNSLIYKDLIRGLGLFLAAAIILSAIDNKKKSREFLLFFTNGLMIVAVFCSAAILIKYWLTANTTDFVWSLVKDYNFFSLTLMVGLLALNAKLFQDPRRLRQVFFVSMLIFVFSIGWLSASRRFMVLAPLLLVGQHFFLIFYNQQKDFTKRAVYLSTLSSLIILCLIGAIFTLLAEDSLSLNRLQIMVDNPLNAIVPRLERWKTAIVLYVNNPIFLFGDFDYLKLYSCKFLDCKGYDYPHSPPLSALLYGGAIGFMVSSILIIYAVILTIENLKIGGIPATIGFCMIAILPYCLISGNTMFSLPVFFSFLVALKIGLIQRNYK